MWNRLLRKGSTCHASTLPAFVRAPTLMMQPSLDIKSFIPFPMDTGSAVGLFPNFNTMDPVQKAVINHTFGVSAPLKKKQIISCNVCQLRFNSESQAEAHYKGSKHAKKLKALEASKNKQKTAPTNDSTKAITSSTTTTAITPNSSEKTDAVRLEFNSVTVNNVLIHTNVGTEVPQPTSVIGETGNLNAHSTKAVISMEAVNVEDTATTSTESEEEKAKKLLYCSLCKVAVNSLSQLEAHNTGSKHKTMVEARIGAGPIKSYPRPGSKAKLQNGTKGSGLQNKTFHCEICDVHVNSEIQLKQHISSRRHKDRVAGKPLKPKYSPYNKLQRNSSILAAKIAFQKDLIKPLAPGFLSNPFAAAAAMTSPLPLHARPATSLFQTTALTPALLRPAPGPIRASPGSILFAPY
ncbi:zinc finger protein 385B isoform X1 [Hemiscyllium ocellatum]|uniref:zinc finger protein 385B isoform X1 n=3 Tax=Hemiscyllium ocellatum TaxID=170820 RepID=UPI002966C9F2|nr:zinc finger protein 385B isoform X1 [Hemiscyllium ocellatum]